MLDHLKIGPVGTLRTVSGTGSMKSSAVFRKSQSKTLHRSTTLISSFLHGTRRTPAEEKEAQIAAVRMAYWNGMAEDGKAQPAFADCAFLAPQGGRVQSSERTPSPSNIPPSSVTWKEMVPLASFR